MAKLEQWSVVAGDFNPYTPPECVERRLHGQVSEHPTFPDGAEVTTSRIVRVAGGERLLAVTNSGTTYELGEIDPRYEEAYPGAKQRFIESWCKRG